MTPENAATPTALIDGLRRIALQAGAAIMKHYETDIKVIHKDDASPVTAADHDAEHVILAGLKEVAPDIPVISEEQAAAGHIPAIENRFFLVDPLDGTREFINKNGEFTVNIGLIENGVPVAGVVYAPAKHRMFYAGEKAKAYEQTIAPSETGELTGPAPKPIAARRAGSSPDPGNDGVTVVASRSHRDKSTDEYLSAYKVKEFIAAGSSLKFCLVATGEADLYPRHGRTMEWDTAAGHAVLRAAGGTVTQLDGQPFLYGKLEDGLANPFFVAKGQNAK